MPLPTGGISATDSLNNALNGLLSNFLNFSKTNTTTNVYGATPELASSMFGGSAGISQYMPIILIFAILMIFKK